MIINILLFIVLPIAIIGICRKINNDVSLLIAVMISVILLIILLFIGVAQMEYRATNQQYHAFVNTLDTMRQNETSIENAAIQKDIANWNQRIASTQYYQRIFPLFIPGLVQDWEQIQ